MAIRGGGGLIKFDMGGGWMPCCRRLIEKVNSKTRGVICLKLVLPVRLAAFGLIAGNGLYLFFHLETINVITTFITIIVLVIAVSMLRECGRSVEYHREIKDLHQANARE